MSEDIYKKATRSYTQLYEQMTEASLDSFDEIFSRDAIFKDPFNEVKGVPAIRAIFEHMYDTCEQPRFKVISSSREGNTAWLLWEFNCIVRKRAISITGASRIVFSENGKVITHVDYWDAASQVYEQLPLIGWFVKKLRSMFSAPQGKFSSQLP